MWCMGRGSVSSTERRRRHLFHKSYLAGQKGEGGSGGQQRVSNTTAAPSQQPSRPPPKPRLRHLAAHAAAPPLWSAPPFKPSPHHLIAAHAAANPCHQRTPKQLLHQSRGLDHTVKAQAHGAAAAATATAANNAAATATATAATIATANANAAAYTAATGQLLTVQPCCSATSHRMLPRPQAAALRALPRSSTSTSTTTRSSTSSSRNRSGCAGGGVAGHASGHLPCTPLLSTQAVEDDAQHLMTVLTPAPRLGLWRG